MSDAVSHPQLIRFCPYEVDLRSGELRKNGIKVRLTGQPFQILTILLERPGELVTREELQKRLWAADTFVDFDRGLNAAINRVREALGDSAENPHFVETLPRRGYRFIGQVDDLKKIHSTGSKPPTDEPHNRVSGWRIGIAVGAAVLVLGMAFLLWSRHRPIARGASSVQLNVVPLTSLPGQEISPSFSPDGSQVAFGWDGENKGTGFDLYIKVIGTDKPVRLTNRPAPWIGVAWSPDGRNIAVHRMGPEYGGIFLVPALGGRERKLAFTNDLFSEFAAISWSPDSKQLAFAAHRPVPNMNTAQLFLLSLDTLERKPVETGCDLAMDPAFSPDGSTLAYVCTQALEEFSLNLAELRAGTNRGLYRAPQGLWSPTWSRDGTGIIFVQALGPAGDSAGGPAADLWQVSPGQNKPPEKLPVGHDADSPTFSSLGNRLAYVQSASNSNIWRVDLHGVASRAQHANNLAP